MGRPYQSTTRPFQKRVLHLTGGELLTQVIDSPFPLPRIIVLPHHAPHRFIQHCHVQDKRSPEHWQHKHRRIHKALFDPSECLLIDVVPTNKLVLVQEHEEWLTGSGELRYEPCYVIQAPQETSDLLLHSRLRHIKDGFHLVGIYFYPLLTYNEAEQLS